MASRLREIFNRMQANDKAYEEAQARGETMDFRERSRAECARQVARMAQTASPPPDPRAMACFEPKDPSPIRRADNARWLRENQAPPLETKTGEASKAPERPILAARETGDGGEAQDPPLTESEVRLFLGELFYLSHRAGAPDAPVSETVLIKGLRYCLQDASGWSKMQLVGATIFLMRALASLKSSGRIASYAIESPPEVQVAIMGFTLDIPGNGRAPASLNLFHSNLRAGVFLFQGTDADASAALTPQKFAAHRGYLEKLLGGKVEIMTPIEAGIPATRGVLVRRVETEQPVALNLVALPEVIELKPAPGGRITLGTDLFTGEVVTRPLAAVSHMLVVGTSGFGKSVFLHQLVSQVAGHAEVERAYLVDLKGGVEFMPYADNGAVQVVSTYDGVNQMVEELLALMEARQREMVERRERNSRRGRVFVIIDEFAQIQLWPAVTREEKERKARLIGDLTKLSMLGRAVGIVLVAAIQKATTDVMDSSFRANLQGQVCFRVANRLMAASMFGDTDDLRLDPIALPRGRFIFHDPTAGETRYLQAHVAPHAVD